MAEPGQVIENPVMGMHLKFVKTAQSHDGAEWEVEYWYPPHRGQESSVLHVHTTTTETFEILKGSAGYRLGKEVYSLEAGERVTLPMNVPHAHPWNVGEKELHVRQIANLPRPHIPMLLAAEALVETPFYLARIGKVDKNGRPNVLQMAVLTYPMQPHVYLAGIPFGVQRVLFGLLARLGRHFGYKSRYPAMEQTAVGSTL